MSEPTNDEIREAMKQGRIMGIDQIDAEDWFDLCEMLMARVEAMQAAIDSVHYNHKMYQPLCTRCQNNSLKSDPTK